MFPNFFRTIPSEVQSNSARFALMNEYEWEKVATLHETQAIFSQVWIYMYMYTVYMYMYMHARTHTHTHMHTQTRCPQVCSTVH